MRKQILAAALSGSVFALAACSGGAEEAATPAETETPAADAAAGDTAAEASMVMNANTASADELATANGMTPETAAAIVDGRPYASVTDLNAKLVDVVGADEAAKILTSIFVPVNLNTASKEELRLIPGMTDKMEHEFEEYRPYENMEQFDREIGKYVDAAEVARFRNYVTL